jgi:hypothetical protein
VSVILYGGGIVARVRAAVKMRLWDVEGWWILLVTFFFELRRAECAGTSWRVTSVQDREETRQGWVWASVCRAAAEWRVGANWPARSGGTVAVSGGLVWFRSVVGMVW